jgi:ribonuclease P protein component
VSGNLTLPQERKLKTDDISSVFSFGAHKQRNYLKMLVSRNEFDRARFAVVVGKRVARRSVERNYCKRVVRELFRLSCKDMSGWDIVIQVKRKFGKLLFAEIRDEYVTLVNSMKLKR